MSDGPDKKIGPRRAALQERRRRARRSRTAWGTVVTVLVTAVGSTAVLFAAKQVTRPDPVPSASPSPVAPRAVTTAIFGTEPRRGGDTLVWVNLLVEGADGDAAIGYLPARTAAEVPGRGLQGVAGAYGSGGVALALVTLENLLGIGIDHYVELSASDARALLTQVEPLTVDVPDEVRVPAGESRERIIFSTGSQSLPSTFLVRLLYTLGSDGDDITLGARHIAFWSALLDAFEADPDSLARAIVEGGGALGKSDREPGELAATFEALATLGRSEVALRTLSVTPLEVPGSELYVAEEDEIETFVTDVVGEGAGPLAQARVQILNGNGVPGIGQEVATRLVGEGFRVILSGNARRLDHERTLVITYDSSEETTALAERAIELLGVGRVQVSTQDQGIVDLTIVVGKDFLRTR